ncbi:MAG: response regulator transcription factor [Verrucomicrobiae bacterium]|nr:response regulator transcription factor [Verrucomicrobiae bacterium]
MDQSGQRQRVLIVDDDRKLCRLIGEYLGSMGYEVEAVHTGLEGAEPARAGSWHAVILDVMLPGLDGFEVLRRIRAGSDVPVLMLSARGDETDRIVGLELGADDYLPKSFSSRELLARLRAVTRRSVAARPAAEGEPEELVVGDLRLHPGSRVAVLGDQSLSLTAVEFDLLLSLARARGRVKTREQLVEEIRERDYDVFDRSVDVHVSALRRKLGDDAREPRFIRTVRAVGYMMLDPNRA